MAMRLGDSLLLSTIAPSGISACASSSSSSSSTAAAVNGYVPVLRTGHRTTEPVVLAGGVPCFESRVARRNGSRERRVPAIIRAAAEPRSVDAPQSSSASASESNGSQARSHLGLLQRMTENSSASQGGATIRDQLSSQVEPEAAAGEAVVSLASLQRERGGERKLNEKENDKAAAAAAAAAAAMAAMPVPEGLTISQRRNIRRQNYLNKVSERNDAPFFATVAAIVLVPPLLILAAAVATGYVELFP